MAERLGTDCPPGMELSDDARHLRLCAAMIRALIAERSEKHCSTCICGRRAPVQANRGEAKGPGTVSWEEHALAWSAYAARYGTRQSAERIAERGGFCYGELREFLGREPATWSPRAAPSAP